MKFKSNKSINCPTSLDICLVTNIADVENFLTLFTGSQTFKSLLRRILRWVFEVLLLLLLLSHFSHVRLCVTPWTAARQAPLSQGFSRKEQWSGLPFPSPMHESEK